jgi:hypothetical protein
MGNVNMYKPSSRLALAMSCCLIVSFAAEGLASQHGTKRRKAQPPIIRCGGPVCTGLNAERTQIDFGERTRLTASAADSDGDVLKFRWEATGGTIEGGGSTVDYVASDVAAGDYTVTAFASDDDGHTVECSVTIHVGPATDTP